jgi:putative SOS response-associated peptidase YedK
MCGRSSLHDAPRNVLEHFELPPVLPGFEPRYNISPSLDQYTITLDAGRGTAVTPRRWGLVPWWADDPSMGARLINARAESIAERPAFRDAFAARRCLVVADGYYEWQGSGRGRTPYFFHMSDNRAFVFAGLWERWRKGGAELETCVIITTDASPEAARIHDRMPAIIPLERAKEWIDMSTPPRDALGLLVPYAGSDLECYEVSRFVNGPANDSPECIAPVQLLL